MSGRFTNIPQSNEIDWLFLRYCETSRKPMPKCLKESQNEISAIAIEQRHCPINNRTADSNQEQDFALHQFRTEGVLEGEEAELMFSLNSSAINHLSLELNVCCCVHPIHVTYTYMLIISEKSTRT